MAGYVGRGAILDAYRREDLECNQLFSTNAERHKGVLIRPAPNLLR